MKHVFVDKIVDKPGVPGEKEIIGQGDTEHLDIKLIPYCNITDNNTDIFH